VKGYPSPLVALTAGEAKRDAKLLSQISKRAKHSADAFTLAAYDAFNVAARTLAASPADVDAATLRTAFAQNAEGSKGTAGTIQLDAAGDRVSTPYAFWSLCQRARSPRWTQTGTWTPASDPTAPGRVSPKSCPKA
jgi:ABC-type branched-subunit amino acid transport system substrate-binding protein